MKLKKSIKKLLCLGVIASLLGILMPFASAKTVMAAENTVVIPVSFEQTEARNMLGYVNTFRASNDAWLYGDTGARELHISMTPLTYDYELERAAMIRAAELALYYSGTRPNLSSYQTLNPLITGENTAAGFDKSYDVFYSLRDENATTRVNQAHRATMVNETNKFMGVGHCIYNGNHYWVQLFSADRPVDRSSLDPKLNNIPVAGERNYNTNFKLAVDDSVITGLVRTSQNSIDIKLGNKIGLDNLGIGMTLTNHYPANANSPILGSYTNVISGNPSILSYNSATGEFIANSVGSTNITVSMGVRSVTIPVSVSYNGYNPYNPYSPVVPPAFENNAVYRMRNIRTGEHLYTTDPNEYAINVRYGWVQEGLAFIGLPYSAPYNVPIVRLERNGRRIYTIQGSKEYYNLITTGRYVSNGVVFYAYTENYFPGNTNIIPVFRMYYPKTGAHLWTTDLNEYYANTWRGWRQEGVAYYAQRQ